MRKQGSRTLADIVEAPRDSRGRIRDRMGECVACGRHMSIQARGMCCRCYEAQLIEEGRARNANARVMELARASQEALQPLNEQVRRNWRSPRRRRLMRAAGGHGRWT